MTRNTAQRPRARLLRHTGTPSQSASGRRYPTSPPASALDHPLAHLTFGIAGSETGFVLDMDSLAAYFERLHDGRCARGKRYRLAQICILATLAKLSGEDRPLGMAQWAQLRHTVLGPLLGLPKRMPSHNTYRRALPVRLARPNWINNSTPFCGSRVGGAC